MSARAAISSTVVPWMPRSSKSSKAAATMASRVRAARRSRSPAVPIGFIVAELPVGNNAKWQFCRNALFQERGLELGEHRLGQALELGGRELDLVADLELEHRLMGHVLDDVVAAQDPVV